MKTKVIKVTQLGLVFDNGYQLYSDHETSCCEFHELNFDDLTIDDFKDLEFDLSGDSFFNRIEGYGIELVPVQGYSVRIPGHGSNNGYYGTNIDLVILTKDMETRHYDITECQTIDWR